MNPVFERLNELIPINKPRIMADASILYVPQEPQGYGAFDYGQNNTDRRDINTEAIDNIEWDGIDMSDYPDFCDAYIVSADMFGHPMTDEELDDLNENYFDFKYEKLMNHLF